MNNNIDIGNFDKMLGLAEFGAKRHNERRQNLFKAIIAYITLLVLALYYTLNNENMLDSSLFIFVAIALLVFHYIYLKWLWVTSIASINDVRRRDFYLKKAEVLSYHLSRSRFSSFGPDPCKYIKLNMASGRSWKVSERCLFEMRAPHLVIGKATREEPPDPKWYGDIHFWVLAFLPTAILFLLITKLLGIIWPWGISIILARIVLVVNLLG